MVTPANHYCYLCGATLQVTDLENRPREACPRCGWVRYAQLKVGAGLLIEQDGRVLLVRRGLAPWEGCWCLPAGYVEADERPELAASRETFEETGLVADAKQLLGAFYFDDDPRGNGLLLLYQGVVTGGALQPGPESREAGYFLWEALPANLSGGAHEQVLRRIQAERLAGRLIHP